VGGEFQRRRSRGRFEAWTTDVIVHIRSRDIEMYVNMAAERKSLTTGRVVVDRFHAFFRFLHSTLLQIFDHSCQGLQSSCPSNKVADPGRGSFGSDERLRASHYCIESPSIMLR